jgi:hypothetical protein
MVTARRFVVFGVSAFLVLALALLVLPQVENNLALSLEGRVMDSAGRPIPNVGIYVQRGRIDHRALRYENPTGLTDNEGVFRASYYQQSSCSPIDFFGPVGRRVALVFRKPGYSELTRDYELSKLPERMDGYQLNFDVVMQGK